MSTHHYIDVLRYWVAAIRHEESLTIRPKAIRQSGPSTFNWKAPIGNHTYFKTARNDAVSAFIMGDSAEVECEVHDEQRSFLGRQVRQVYYRQDHAWQVDESVRANVVFGFPALYMPRSDELATLIRCRASVAWLDDASNVVIVPSKRERGKKKYPKPPSSYRLKRTLDEDDELLPLSLDARLMSQELGFPEEVVLDFTNALRACEHLSAAQMIGALIRLMDLGEWPESEVVPEVDDTADLLFELVKAVRTRLIAEGSTLVAYDIGLTYDGAQLFTTHHLRRDLSLMISGRSRKSLVHDGPLRAYLSRSAPQPGFGLLIGQSADTASSPSQRRVAERFLGSVFTAAQGPPGTGKTRLILDVAAHVLIQRMSEFARNDVLEGPTLLVTSTNNRAVDQVLGSLQSDLPWGLRAGSQQVTETATVAVIDDVLKWLDRHEETSVDLDAEKKRFLEVYEAALSETAPHDQLRQQTAKRLELEHQLTQLSALEVPSLYGSEVKLLEVKLHFLDDVLDRMVLLRRRLSAIDRLLHDHGQRAFEAAAAAWQKLKRGPWSESKQRFEACGLTRADDPIQTPKKSDDVAQICAQWQASVQSVLDDLDDMYGVVDSVRNYRLSASRIEVVRERLSALPKPTSAPIDHTSMNAAQYTLFRSAQRLRKSWVCSQKNEVRRALKRLRDIAIEFRSLRRFFQDLDQDATVVRTIFPVIGSTLLSVANVLGQDPDSVSHVVIDEGGQCHPAYAVSALMRAKRALIIGDVHQLEPVFTLSREDEKRVQTATRIALDDAQLDPFRVFESCGNSAQLIADQALGTPPRLIDHYRSNESLIGLCDELCDYGLTVHTEHRALPADIHQLRAPFLCTPVAGVQRRTRGSWSNETEVDATIEWILYLLSQGLTPQHLAVLTPYVGQLDALRARMQQRGLPVFDQPNTYDPSVPHIPIGTVHRFQGGERDIILYSSVVSEARSLHFQNQRVNLLNVAVSRARQHFITIGDIDILAKGRYTSYLVSRSTRVERKDIIGGQY